MSAPARPEDVDEICAALPHTQLGTSWGAVPTWKVPEGEKGRGFVLYREPHASALDPATGEPFDDLLVVHTPSMADKEALVEADGPFFTIEHFRRSSAVLVQLSRLGEITRDELAEVITDAWAHRAPARIVKEYRSHG